MSVNSSLPEFVVFVKNSLSLSFRVIPPNKKLSLPILLKIDLFGK